MAIYPVHLYRTNWQYQPKQLSFWPFKAMKVESYSNESVQNKIILTSSNGPSAINLILPKNKIFPILALRVGRSRACNGKFEKILCDISINNYKMIGLEACSMTWVDFFSVQNLWREPSKWTFYMWWGTHNELKGEKRIQMCFRVVAR